ncbi:MAG TPA: DUF4381 domain-containing protein [Thiothrix sp.]|nr:DUF4381 domain-containing protein [Thiothrix sp.]
MEQELPLRDIHLPDPISWWPLAWGWWLLIIAALCFLTLITLWLLRRSKKTKNIAKPVLFMQTLNALKTEKQAPIFATKLSALLKHSAVYYYGQQAAGLSGEAWLAFLDQSWALGKTPEQKRTTHIFSSPQGRALLSAPYQANPVIDQKFLWQLAYDWLHLPHNPKDQNVNTQKEGSDNQSTINHLNNKKMNKS